MKKKYGIERRRFIRHPMCFPLSYRVVNKATKANDELKSRTKNISRDGLLFLSRRKAEKGAIIVIRIPFEDKIFKVRAKVVHCMKAVGSKLYDVGVCFQRINDAFKVKLIEQLYLISEYRDLLCIQLGREVSLEEASKEWIKRYSKRFQKLYW